MNCLKARLARLVTDLTVVAIEADDADGQVTLRSPGGLFLGVSEVFNRRRVWL